MGHLISNIPAARKSRVLCTAHVEKSNQSLGMLEPITFRSTREIVHANDLPFCPRRVKCRLGVPEASGSWHSRLYATTVAVRFGLYLNRRAHLTGLVGWSLYYGLVLYRRRVSPSQSTMIDSSPLYDRYKVRRIRMNHARMPGVVFLQGYEVR